VSGKTDRDYKKQKKIGNGFWDHGRHGKTQKRRRNNNQEGMGVPDFACVHFDVNGYPMTD
jgi:hypothetical protein